MRHIQLFEEFINEKAYRLTGHYAAKGIVGKIMQSFKKEIEKIKYEGDADKTLKDVNKAWEHFHKEGTKIILDEVKKAVHDMKNVVYVHVDGLQESWEADTVNKINRADGPLYITLPSDFVINVGFMDDVDGSKFKNKLGGMMNSAIKSGEDLYGSFDHEIGENNVEIRAHEVIELDAK